MGVQEREKKGREVAVLNGLEPGEIRGCHGTTRDISQSKRLREKTERKGVGNPIPLLICSPGLKSWCKHNVRIELIVGSLYIFYFSGISPGFPHSSKINNPEFQFNLESVSNSLGTIPKIPQIDQFTYLIKNIASLLTAQLQMHSFL